jgi:RNA:NAD 2'-phosphotransferase (TPT1/KptA family)
MVTVYHGTSEENLPSILRRGLVPNRRKNHPESGRAVYVERSARTARAWARQAGSRSRRYVVIELEVPETLLEPDPRALSKTSLKAQQIPARYIRGWDTYEMNLAGDLDYCGSERCQNGTDERRKPIGPPKTDCSAVL